MADTSIRLDEETRDELKDMKRGGESYDDVLRRLIDAYGGEDTRARDEPVSDEREPAQIPEDRPPIEEPEPSPPPLKSLEFPRGRDRDECIAAIHAARGYIAKSGGATQRELVKDVMPKHSIDYEVPDLETGQRYKGSWWRRVVKPGLEAFDDVEKPIGGGKWRVE